MQYFKSTIVQYIKKQFILSLKNNHSSSSWQIKRAPGVLSGEVEGLAGCGGAVGGLFSSTHLILSCSSAHPHTEITRKMEQVCTRHPALPSTEGSLTYSLIEFHVP